MGIYANGRNAAVAAIQAAILARVTTGTDGAPTLNIASVQTWMYDQLLDMISTDVPAADRDAARDAMNLINGQSDVDRLARAYAPATWNTRPDFPTSASIASSPAFVSAASLAITEMEQLVTELQTAYGALEDTLPEVINAAYVDGGMLTTLPALDVRNVETRFYQYTWVNDLDEESAPSPVSAMVEVDERDKVPISILAPPPGRNINRWRFYRSNTGTVNTVFQFLTEGPVTTLAGVDSIRSSALGEVLETSTWDEPPAKMRGICEVHTGIIAGFYDNTTAFCVPFHPYAWDRNHELSCAYPIIAQQSFGQTLVRFHLGGVDYIGGADPGSMSVQTDVSQQVCASARSVCKVDGGVVFASQDGLCLASGNGVQVITLNKILRDDWQAYQPETMFCHHNEGSVYLWGVGVPGVMALHLATGRITTVNFPLGGGMSAVFETGKALYGTNGTQVYRLFAGPGARTAVWRSKIIVLPKQEALAWLVVESDFAPGSDPITVKWFGDGVLRYTAVLTRRAPVRLPAGRWLEHEIEVSSKSRWNALTLATSTAELQGA